MRHNQMGFQSHVVQAQPTQAIPLNIARYRKTVNCAMWGGADNIGCLLSAFWCSHSFGTSKSLLFIDLPYYAIYDYFCFS